MNKRRYYVSEKQIQRKKIHSDLVLAIKKVQRKLQMKENLRHGSKAKKVTFQYASKEVLKKC